MIIHCSQCGTRYRFSEEKIKPGGTKVRCARCRNVFVVMPAEETSPFESIFEPERGAEESASPAQEASAGTASGGSLFRGVPGARDEETEQITAAEKETPVGGDESRSFPEEKKLEDQLEEQSPAGDEGIFAEMEKEAAREGEEDASAPFEEQSIVPPPSGVPGDEIFIQDTSGDAASPEPSGKGRSVIGRIFMLFFFLVVILCSGIAGYLFWRGEPFDIPHLMKIFQKQDAPAPKPVGKIHLKGVHSFYVFNKEAGQLFVITGTAVNEFSEDRSGISVKGILYDDKGRELRQQTVFCGNPFEKVMLSNMPYKNIEENMNNQFGTTFSNLNIGPGKEIPFSIVFRNLPENLSEFSVEVVGSKAAEQKK